jgi:hypothetical protein
MTYKSLPHIYYRPRIRVVRSRSRYSLLAFILLFSMFNQWIRWLPVYLSAVTDSACDSLCDNIPFTPLCKKCESLESDSILAQEYPKLSASSSSTGTAVLVNDAIVSSCEACHSCRRESKSEVYNLMDGICMSTKQYAMLTGLGFSLTFGAFGLFAGLLVDFKSGKRTKLVQVCL